MQHDFKNIVELISSFKGITLEELNSVRLMDREDTKYIFNIDLLPDILMKLTASYNMLTINDHRLMTYDSLYFDTPDKSLYLQHHNGKLNRYKVRYRKYVETDTCFFELKVKTNKYRTVKKRIAVDHIPQNPGSAEISMIEEVLPIDVNLLEPTCNIGFKRMTMADKDFQDRLTIDIGLQASVNERSVSFPYLVIAEIKQERFSTHSPFIQVMRGMKIEPMRLSKYCISVVNLYPNVKYNRFKPKILTINKIKHAVS
ncbi:MAG: polyphosphate polymerase domain-containing protein [Bacteroidetes bacterium]|nr:polyphosphate polymerase domain-containing protein [Bacteroidota bacterium]